MLKYDSIRWAGVLLVSGCLIALGGCGKSPEDGGGSVRSDGSYRRAVCFLPSFSNNIDISDQIQEGLAKAEKECKDLQLSLYYSGDFTNLDYETSMQTAAAMQTDYVIAFGNGKYQAEQAGAQADTGFWGRADRKPPKLVILDDDITNEQDRIIFVGTDNRSALDGVTDAILDHVTEPSVAAFITNDHLGTRQRLEELKRITVKSENARVVSVTYLSTDAITAQQEMRDALAADKTINTVVCIDGYSSRTAVNVLPNYNGKYYAIGFDTSEEIVRALENGTIALLVAQDYEGMGEAVVHAIDQYQEGDPPRAIYTDCIYYTGEDAPELLRRYDDEEE